VLKYAGKASASLGCQSDSVAQVSGCSDHAGKSGYIGKGDDRDDD
jgi:hypothetical protein